MHCHEFVPCKCHVVLCRTMLQLLMEVHVYTSNDDGCNNRNPKNAWIKTVFRNTTKIESSVSFAIVNISYISNHGPSKTL